MITLRYPRRLVLHTVVLLGFALSVSGCNFFSRVSEIGTGPELSRIQDPMANPNYQPVSLPMPAPMPAERNPNSLWRAGARSFFKDQRASKVGDILTVVVEINDQAQLDNATDRARNASEDAGLANFLGFESDTDGGTTTGTLEKIFNGIDPANIIGATSSSSNNGDGSIGREEQIELRFAAIITQILPNGNLVIHGSQEVRVNYELRQLSVDGVVRPEDISAFNEIRSDQIAEARIYYGGRGYIADAQKPRWGQELYDIVWPW